MSFLFLTKGGGSINVGELLGENHHRSNLIVGESLLLSEGGVPLLWITSYTTSLSIQIPDQPLSLANIGAFLKAFLHPSYNAII